VQVVELQAWGARKAAKLEGHAARLKAVRAVLALLTLS
jgi:hypothetical protein